MVRFIVSASVKFRLLVLALAAGLLALGAVQLPRTAIDALPEFSPPFVEVQTEALGLSADEVEQLITVPLEADLLNGVQGVSVIRSDSMTGLSRVVMVFEPGTTLYEARSRVQEKLVQAHALPQVSKPPTMLQPLSATSRLMMISLSSDTLSPIQRSVLARWTVKPRLMGIPGVANVAIWGQQERQLQVQVDPKKLKDANVTLEQVVASTGNAQIVSPLSFLEASTPGTGGFIETAQQRLQVRHVFDKLATASELAKIPIDGTHGKLRLSDVATVVEDHQPLIGAAIVNGKSDGLVLVVEKFPNANPVTVSKAVEAALTELRPGLSGITVDSQVFQSGNYVTDSFSNIYLVTAIALALFALVVGLVFASWRVALVGLATVGLALTAGALVTTGLRETLNSVTVAGLAMAAAVIAFGAVRESQTIPTKEEGTDALLAHASWTRGTAGYALAIGVAAVVPLAVVQGTAGMFFAPAVVAYVTSLVAAFVVTLTVGPALASFLVGRRPVSSPLLARVTASRPLAAIGRPVALMVAGALALVSMAGVLLMPKKPLPELLDRDLVVSLTAPAGTSLPAMTGQVSTAVQTVQNVPGVEKTTATVGRAITGDQISDVNTAELWVRLGVGSDFTATLAAVRTALSTSGVTSTITPYVSRRLQDIGAVSQTTRVEGNSLDVLTGTSYPLTVRVYGEDPVVMQAKADEVLRGLKDVDGVRDAKILSPTLQDSIQITVDLDRAKKYGIKPGDVRRAEATLVQGIQVGSIFEGQKVFDVIVQGAPGTRASVDAVKKLLIDAPSGGHVTLDQVANVEIVKVPTVIQRESVARSLDVVAMVDGDLQTIADAAEDVLDGISFPLEHHGAVLVASTAKDINSAGIFGFGLAAAAAVFLLLQAATRSWQVGARAMLALLAGASGGVVAAIATGGTLGSWLGLIATVALAGRGALALREGSPGAVEDGPPPSSGASGVAGVLASVLGVAALVIPAAVFGGRAGLEILQPLALVVLGGLVTIALVALLQPVLAATSEQPEQAVGGDQAGGAE